MCVCVLVLTPGLTWSINGDLYGSMVSGHLWWVGEYCDCQCEALACGDIKQHQMTYHPLETMTSIHVETIPNHKCGCSRIIANTNWEKSSLRKIMTDYIGCSI